MRCLHFGDDRSKCPGLVVPRLRCEDRVFDSSFSSTLRNDRRLMAYGEPVNLPGAEASPPFGRRGGGGGMPRSFVWAITVLVMYLALPYGAAQSSSGGQVAAEEEQCALIDLVWCATFQACVADAAECEPVLTEEEQCALIDLEWCESAQSCALSRTECEPVLTEAEQCALIDLEWCGSLETCVAAAAECEPVLTEEEQCALIDLEWCESTQSCVVDIDDCACNPCGFGICTDTGPNSYDCACNQGYTFGNIGIKQTCVEMCPARGEHGCCTDTNECPSLMDSRGPPTQVCGWDDCHWVCDCVCAIDRSQYDGLLPGHSGRFDTSNLGKQDRLCLLQNIALQDGETMEVDCADEGEDGCELCSSDSGCSFGTGSVVRMAAGNIRLPEGSSIGSHMHIELGSNATFEVEGGDTSLSGALEGKLKVGGGIVRLSGVSGTADIEVAAGSTLYFEGNGDTELALNNSGEIVFDGQIGFKSKIMSSGTLTFLDGSEVSFESDEQSTVADVRTNGTMRVAGAGGLYVQRVISSYGHLNVSSGSSLKIESLESARSIIGGDGLVLESAGELEVAAGSVSFQGPIRSEGRVHISQGLVEFGSDDQHVIRGDGLMMDENAVLEVQLGELSITGPVESSGFMYIGFAATLNVGSLATFSGSGFESYGVVSLSAESDASGSRRLQEQVLTGVVEIAANTSFESYGHLAIPADASILFSSNSGTSFIAGEGVDSSGDIRVEGGSVHVTSGGVRSAGTLSVTGGSLYFDSDANSALTGPTIIGANGSVFVLNGTVYVHGEVEILGTMTVGPSGKIALAESTGVVCPETLARERCEDWVCEDGFHADNSSACVNQCVNQCVINQCVCLDSAGFEVGTGAQGEACTDASGESIDGSNVCVSCVETHFLDGDQCSLCTPVENAAQDANVTCSSANTSRVTSCADGFYKTQGGPVSADSCTVFSRCLESQYESQAPTSDSDRVCSNVRVCKTVVYWESAGAFVQTVGAAVSGNAPLLAALGGVTGADVAALSSLLEQGRSDRVETWIRSQALVSASDVAAMLDALNSDEFVVEFMTNNATNTTDRECQKLTVCNASQCLYESVPASAVADRQCEVCSSHGTCESGKCACEESGGWPVWTGSACHIDVVLGCTTFTATNFNPSANYDDGSCQYDACAALPCQNCDYSDECTCQSTPTANEFNCSCATGYAGNTCATEIQRITTAAQCVASGPNIGGARERTVGSFSVTLKDQFGRPRVFSRFPTEQVAVGFDGTDNATVTVVFSILTGKFLVEYLIGQHGTYQMNVTVDEQHIAGSPFAIEIVADVGPANGPTSVLTGLDSTITAGANVALSAQLRDMYGSSLIEGGDDVALEILDSGGQVVESEVFADQLDGSYTVEFTLIVSGAYTVGATVNGAAIASSPQAVVVLATTTSVTLSQVSNLQPTLRAGELSTFTIRAFDEFNNSNTEGAVGADFSARMDGTDVTISHVSLGEYSATFGSGLRARSEPILISVFLGVTILEGFPREIKILPGTPVASMSTASGSGLMLGVAGTPSQIVVISRDRYGSACDNGGGAVALTFLSVPDNAIVPDVSFTDHGNGTYSADFELVTAGTYSLQIALGDNVISNMPVTRVISAAGPSASGTSLQVQNSALAAGTVGSCTLVVRDEFGNCPVYNPSAAQASFRAVATRGDRSAAFSSKSCSSREPVGLDALCVVNNLDGTFGIKFSFSQASHHVVTVFLANSQTIVGSNFTVSVSGASVSAATSQVGAPAAISSVAGEAIEFGIVPLDAYGNDPSPAAQTSDFALAAVLSTTSDFVSVSGTVASSASGFVASVIPEVAGVYTISVHVAGDLIRESTLTATVGAAAASSTGSTVEGEGWLMGQIDVPLVATVVVRDAFGNLRNTGDDNVTLLVDNAQVPGVYVGDGQYSLSRSYSTPGTFPASIMVNDFSITSSVGDGWNVVILQSAGEVSQVTVVAPHGSATAGVQSTFLLEGRDDSGILVSEAANHKLRLEVPQPPAVTTLELSGPVNGSYTVTYTALVAGTVNFTVALAGETVATVSRTIVGAAVRAANSTLTGATSVIAGAAVELTVQLRDEFGNAAVGASARVALSDAAGLPIAIPAGRRSIVVAMSAPLTTSGEHLLYASFDGSPIQGSPLTVVVSAGPTRPTLSTAAVPAAFVAGRTSTVVVRTRDEYGNLQITDSSNVRLVAVGPENVTTSDYAVRESVADGRFNLGYTLTVSGAYETTVYVNGEPVATETVRVSPAAAYGPRCITTGLTRTMQAGVASSFAIAVHDQYGNAITSGGAVIDARLSGPKFVGTDVTMDPATGIYAVSFSTGRMGTYMLRARVQGSTGYFDLPESPMEVIVGPGVLNLEVSASTLGGSATLPFVAGDSVVLTVIPSDLYGNQVSAVSGFFHYTLDQTDGSGRAASGTVAADADLESTYRTWLATMVATKATAYTLSAWYTSNAGSVTELRSFAVVAKHAAASATATVFDSVSLSVTAGGTTSFTITCFDEFGNAVTDDTIPVTAVLTRGTATILSAADDVSILPGSRMIEFSSTVSDSTAGSPAQVLVNIAGVPVTQSVSVVVHPGGLSSVSSIIVSESSWADGSVVAGQTVSVTVQTRDEYSNSITATADDLQAAVKIVNRAGALVQVGSELTITAGEASISFQSEIAVVHGVHVISASGAHLAGSPASVLVTHGPVSPTDCVVLGSRGGLIGSQLSLHVMLLDRYSNPVTSGSAAVTASVSPGYGVTVSVADASTTEYLGSQTTFVAVNYHLGTLSATPIESELVDDGLRGTKSVSIVVNEHSLADVQIEISANIGEVDGPACDYSVPTAARAGQLISIAATARDANFVLVVPGYSLVTFTGQVVSQPAADTAAATISDFIPGDRDYDATMTPTVAGSYVIDFYLLLPGSETAQNTHTATVTVVPNVPVAANCRVEGAGLTGGTAGVTYAFNTYIQDEYNNAITAPSAEVSVTVELESLNGAQIVGAWGCAFASAAFECRGTQKRSGSFAVAVNLVIANSSEPIAGSPFSGFVIQPARLSAQRSTVAGPGLLGATAGAGADVIVTARDQFGNMRVASDDSESVSVRVNGPTQAAVTLAASGNGTYSASYIPTIATARGQGRYEVRVVIVGTEILYVPSITVTSGVPSSVHSKVTGLRSGLQAGTTTGFVVEIFDAFRNVAGDAGVKLVGIQLLHSSGYSPKVTSTLRAAGSGLLDCEYRAIRAGNFSLNVSFAHSVAILRSITWIPADPPRLSHAIVMKNGQGVQLAFDKRTDGGGKTGQFQCAVVLATADSLGVGATCQWTQSDLLTAKFGDPASRTVLPFVDLTVLDDTIGRAGLDSFKSTGSTQLLPPCGMGPDDCILEEPLLSVPHPAYIGECDDFVFDASGSKDPALGTPTFSYAVDWDAPNAVQINEQLLAESSAFATINNTILQGDTNYTFTVRMMNSYEQQVTYTGWFYKTGLPVPKIIVSGDSTQEVDYREHKYLQADATLSACPGASTSLDFEWSTEAEGVTLNAKTVRTRRLFVEKNTLQPPNMDFDGVYSFDLIGSDSTNPTVFGTTQVQLQVLSSPVRAVIKGGDRVASLLQNLVLDGSDSTDPDDLLQVSSEFVYTWSCATADGLSCFENEATGFAAGEQLGGGTFSDGGASVTIEQGKLKLGALIFTLEVQKTPGPRVDTMSATIVVVSGQVPNVDITPREQSYVLPDDSLYIYATAAASPDGNGELTYRWYEEALENGGSGLILTSLSDLPLGHSGTITAESNSAHLVIGPGQLTGGQTYVFSLEVTEQTPAGTNVAVSRQQLFVNDAPSSGLTTLSPTQGYRMQTVYSARFEGWLDDQRPLAYSVSTIDSMSKEAFLMTPQRSNTLNFKLPDAGTVRLATDVYDSYGSSARAVFDVVNEDAPYGPNSAKGDLDAAVGTGDFASLSQVATAFTAGRRRRLQENGTCVDCSLVENMYRLLNSTVLNQADVAQYLSTISVLAGADISDPSLAAETTLQLISAYMVVVDAARDLGMSIETATTVVEVAHKLAGSIIGDGCSSEVTTTRVEPLRRAMEAIVHGLLRGTSSPALAGEAAKLVYSAAVDTASENRISVRGQRSTSEGMDGAFVSDTGVVSTFRVAYSDVRKVLQSTSKDFDLLYGIVGRSLVCDESTVLSSVHTIALYEPASLSPHTALTISAPVNLTVGVRTKSSSHYAACQQLGSNGWTVDGVTTSSYDASAAVIICQLDAINGATMVNVVQQAWSSCTTDMQFQVAPPSDTSDTECQLLTTCDPVTQYQSVAPSNTSDRVCSALSVCHTNAIIAVPASATTDRICECTGFFFGNGTDCGAWTVCGQNANSVTEGSSTTDRRCACDLGYWEQDNGQNGGGCVQWRTCDVGFHEIVQPTSYNDRECEPNACTVPTAAPEGYSIDLFACSNAVTGSIACETPATCTSGYYTSTEVSYSCPAHEGQLELAGCVACQHVLNALPDAAVTCSTANNSRVTACKAGFYKDITGEADECIACTAVANAASNASYSCNSAADSRVSRCGEGHFKDGTAAADLCNVCAECAPGTFTTAQCTEVSDQQCASCTTVDHAIADATYTCTSASDSRVSACAAGYEKVVGGDQAADTCVAISGRCGGNADTATDYTCPAGYHALIDQVTRESTACAAVTCSAEETQRRTQECCADDCPTRSAADPEVCCTPVDFALLGTVYTCGSDSTNSRIEACAAGYFKNSDNAADVCTTCTPVQNAAADASVTCTTSLDSRTDACTEGHYRESTESRDFCRTCMPVANAAGSATYTCSSSSTSRASGCAAGFYKDSSGEADLCTRCVFVPNSATGAAVSCSNSTDSRVTECKAGFYKDITGEADECKACTVVANAASDALYSCNSAADSRVSSCKQGHLKNSTAPADACTAWTPCGANAETQQEGTAATDRVCVCSDGYYSATSGGSAFEDCVAWSACQPGLEVSLVGSASRDQVCGLKLVASTRVPMAVSVDAFKSSVAAASGYSGAIVDVTHFEQRVEAAATFPGSSSDYDSAEAQAQFRQGVATALRVDLAAVSDITVSSGGAGRRLLDSSGQLRRLQASVLISYVVTVADTSTAATVTTATQSTVAFAQTLVNAVNEERQAAGAPLVDASQVSVEQPVITTDIQYEVVVRTSDTSVVSSIQTELRQASVIAAALSATLGITIDASALTVVATVACSRPAVQGYKFSETSVLPGPSFDVSALCAPGWEGTPTATSCTAGPATYTVSGCTPIVCESSLPPPGYTNVVETQLDRSLGFEVAAICDASSQFSGTAEVVPCTTNNASYGFTGCEPCDASQCAMCVFITRSLTICESWGMDCGCFRALANTCTIPTEATGADLTGLNCTNTTSGFVDCPGEPTCAPGYSGAAVAECELLPAAGPDPALSFAGCRPITGRCFGNAGGMGDYSCPIGMSPRSGQSRPSARCASQTCSADEQTRRNGECCVPNPAVEVDDSADASEESVAGGGVVLYSVGTVLVLAACLLLCVIVRWCIWKCCHPAGSRGVGKPSTVIPEPAQRPRVATRMPTPAAKPSPPTQPLPPLKLRGREMRVARAQGALPPIQPNPVGPAGSPGGLIPQPPTQPSRSDAASSGRPARTIP